MVTIAGVRDAWDGERSKRGYMWGYFIKWQYESMKNNQMELEVLLDSLFKKSMIPWKKKLSLYSSDLRESKKC